MKNDEQDRKIREAIEEMKERDPMPHMKVILNVEPDRDITRPRKMVEEKRADNEPEWGARLHPRDILKEEYDRSLVRPRDVAVEKWGPEIEREVERRLEAQREAREKDGPEMDRE